MTLRPCLVCGDPTSYSRCDLHRHRPDTKPSARDRGYSTTWDKLSKRARRLQPFCSDCGAVDDLTSDHLPSAWVRHQAGLAVRLEDVEVVCRGCNARRGAARPRGDDPQLRARDPRGKAQSRSLLEVPQ